MSQDLCSSTFGRYVRYVLDGFFGKTSRERSQARMGRLSDSSCPKWTSSGTAWRGAYSMRSSSEWPKDAAVSFLSDILEPAPPIGVLIERSAGFKYHQGAGAGGVGAEPEQSPTLTADWHNPAVYPIDEPITMADLNANTAIGYDMVGTLKVGGDAPSVCL